MTTVPLKKPICRFVAVLAALAVCAVSGCGGSKGSITGVVKFNGQPLPSGNITFLGQGGDNQVLHSDIVDGKYSITSMQLGTAKVSVTVPPVPRPGPGPSGEPPPAVDPSKYPQIPARYGNPDQSGLTYEVKSGSQTKDFDLTP